MTEQTIKITSRSHLIQLGSVLGALRIADALKAANDGPLGKLPGFLAACALVDKEVADARGAIVAQNLTLATKAGVDIALNRILNTNHGDLVIRPLDLDELAEEA